MDPLSRATQQAAIEAIINFHAPETTVGMQRISVCHQRTSISRTWGSFMGGDVSCKYQ